MTLKKVSLALVVFFGLSVFNVNGSNDSTKVADGYSENSPVETLTDETFESFINSNELVFVKMYAPWCQHCQKMAPDFEETARVLQANKSKIKVVKVDASSQEKTARKYKVEGFPTLKLFRNGIPKAYDEERDKDTMVEWLTRMEGPALLLAKDEADAKVISKSWKVSFTGTFREKNNAAWNALEKIADVTRTAAQFVAYISPDAKVDTIFVKRSVGNEKSSHQFKSETELEKWIRGEFLPLIGIIGAQQGMKSYVEATLPTMYYIGKEDEFEDVEDSLNLVAKAKRGQIFVAWINSEIFPADNWKDMTGITTSPGLSIVHKGDKYIFDKEVGKAKPIAQFVKNVLEGKIKKFVKSQPIPEANDAPVKIVVSNNFDSMVFQKDKDVMLEIYAPWCKHCKELAPQYEELAGMLKDGNNDNNIVIAKMDGTENESHKDFEYQAYPTIFFVKAGTTKPLKYKGKNDADSLFKYIKKHATLPVVNPKEKERRDEEL